MSADVGQEQSEIERRMRAEMGDAFEDWVATGAGGFKYRDYAAFAAGYQEGERAGAVAFREATRVADNNSALLALASERIEELEAAVAQARADIERQLRDAAAWWDASPALHGSIIGSEIAKVADQLAAEAELQHTQMQERPEGGEGEARPDQRESTGRRPGDGSQNE